MKNSDHILRVQILSCGGQGGVAYTGSTQKLCVNIEQLSQIKGNVHNIAYFSGKSIQG